MTTRDTDIVESLSLTEDRFLTDRLTILQPKKGYRAGIDAVLLAATVTARDDRPESLIDVGSGVGTVGLCAAVRLPRLRVTMLEREPALVEIARRNILANTLEVRVRADVCDVAVSQGELRALGLTQETFDVCLANPPYHDEEAGTPAPHALKSSAHAMPADTLDDWVRFMARMVKPGGRATMIHKSDALPRILDAFEPRFGAILVFPIFPRSGESAIRVIVSGIKGSKAPMQLRPGLVLHGASNDFTEGVSTILRDGTPLDL